MCPLFRACPLGTNGGEVGENWGLWWYGGNSYPLPPSLGGRGVKKNDRLGQNWWTGSSPVPTCDVNEDLRNSVDPPPAVAGINGVSGCVERVPLRIHLEQCGLMVNRNTEDYPSVVYLHEVAEREVTLWGYGQDRYLVRLTGWQAVPAGYLIMV